MSHKINIQCNIANEASNIEAIFEPGTASGAKYTLYKNGEKIGIICRYQNGGYHLLEGNGLTQADIDSIGDQIDHKTDY